MVSLFTSESVTRGHPDKLCDQIADEILDEILAEDPYARVACEVTACTDKVHIMGEISSSFTPDYEAAARRVISEIGYTRPGAGFDADTCRVELDVHEQSPDIARGVLRRAEEDAGAGDQGMMFGYACSETESMMPLPITLANALTRRLEYVRTAGIVPNLLPDGKAQVTVEYRDGLPARISTVIVSAQHEQAVDTDTLRDEIIEHVIRPALPASMLDSSALFYINPTGRFVVGGPAGDSGLTGRKLMADTYGGASRHGGGAFSGKDPTKVDRSGAYMARYIAKNIAASGIASRCEVQIAYAIGLADPVSLEIETFGTGSIGEDELADWVRANVDMRPAMIIRRFDLRRPIYRQLACYGHFGDNAKNMPWEQTDLAERLKAEFVH
jgi:S-adenosylmethionine synthetase